MKNITIATEDELSEAVGLALATEAGFIVDQKLRRNGFGYLKSSAAKFSQLANHRHVFLLTDLDRTDCPGNLIKSWLRSELPSRFIFRVAVREVEAWLLADHEAMRALFGRNAVLPRSPDDLYDPKQHLLNLAKHAGRDIRADLVVAKGAVAAQGLGYNTRLCRFVANDWSASRASERSPSLKKARRRLTEAYIAD